MATEIDWGSIAPPDGGKGGGGGGGKRDRFVKFEAGKGKTLRPVGKPVVFYKFFVNKGGRDRFVIVEPDFRSEAAAKISAYLGKEVIPSRRYAINVIDREDNKIRILEAGPRIFEHFSNWSTLNNGAAPGGINGVDWTIFPSGQKLARQYTVMPGRSSPLSQDEIQRCKEKKEVYNLKEEFKGVSPSEVISKLFGDEVGPEAEPVHAAVGETDLGTDVDF